MISNLKCQICLESFGQKSSPRVCNKCGNSICEACLTGIFVKQGDYICPYCKNKSQEIWAKNISILNMMEIQRGTNLCLTHKRKAVSFCSSSVCNLPIAICDLAQCSKIHKERGTNNIPLSLIMETPDSEQDKQLISKVIENFYDNVSKAILAQIEAKKVAAIERIGKGNSEKSMFKTESQVIVNNIKKCALQGISSEMLSKIKVQLLQEQQHQETNLKTTVNQIVEIQKKELSEFIHSKIVSTEVNFISALEFVKKQSIVKNQNQNQTDEELKFSKKIIIYEETGDVLKNPNDPIQKFLITTKSTEEYNLIYAVLNKNFKPKLLFSAGKNPTTSFKSTLAKQPNLFIRVELADDKVLGCYLKRPYMHRFNSDVFVTDSDAFVYWLNEFKVFKAAKNSVSQYDVSPDYLFSVGNTYKWDGFWFPKNFSRINPDSNKSEIQSQQYTDLLIPIPNRDVRRFQVFVLEFTE